MSTYLESALWDFIKTILTKGIRTLKSPRFFPYTVFLLLIVITGTLATFIEEFSGSGLSDNRKNLLLYIEISAAIAFISVGMFLGRARIILQMVSIVGIVGLMSGVFYDKHGILITVFGKETDLASSLAAMLYVLWIGIISFSTYSLIRDLFASDIFGTVLFLGKPEDNGEVMFKWICLILAGINFSLGYMIYTRDGILKSTEYTAIIIMISSIIAIYPLIGFQRKNDVFFTILSWFYMFTTIRVFLLAFRTFSDSTGETSYWDTLFSLFIALYTIQNAAAKGVKLGQKGDQSLEEELLEGERRGIFAGLAILLTDRGLVLLILGIVMGFHAMQVQTTMGQPNIFQEFEFTSDADIILLGYELNLAISLFIYVMSLVLFVLLPTFRRYSSPNINRLPWLPPYNDLKLVIGGIKDGEISWKGDAMKFIVGMGKDKIAAKFGRKPKSVGDRFGGVWGNMMKKTTKKDK